MAISVSSGTVGTSTGTSSLSFSATVPAGTDMLVVTVSHSRGADSISGVTFNGTSLTRQIASFTNVGAYIYTLASPTITTANIVVSVSAGTDRALVATPIYLSGTSGTIGTVDSIQNGATLSISKTITTLSAGSVVIDCVTMLDNAHAMTPGGSQTSITNQAQSGTSQSETAGASYQTTGAAGSYTMQWTDSASTQWDLTVMEVESATGGGSAIRRALLGVGI